MTETNSASVSNSNPNRPLSARRPILGYFERTRIKVLIAITFVLTTLSLSAQQGATGLKYRVIDLGTLGGPNSAQTQELPYLSCRGQVVGASDTGIPDPNSPDCNQCYLVHAYRWSRGEMADLGTLAGPNHNSLATTVNDSGQTVGVSDFIDPSSGQQGARAVVWDKTNQISNLGLLGGNSFSLAVGINSRGQIAGVSTNGTPDNFGIDGFFDFGEQVRGFISENGVMTDLGTLGGPDTSVSFPGINDLGQIAGVSYTSDVDPVSGNPIQHAYLWQSGVMRDLGTLGGTFAAVNGLNNRGQVAGLSTLEGDNLFHPTLWDGDNVIDLGTLGGPTGFATTINDAGEVAGRARTQEGAPHAFFWKNGAMSDLGTVGDDGCSIDHHMNNQGRVVGSSMSAGCQVELHGFLSIQGGPMIDLNQFLPPGSNLTIVDGEWINDRGEIAGDGLLPNGDFHAVLLVPCSDPAMEVGCRELSTPASAVEMKARSFDKGHSEKFTVESIDTIQTLRNGSAAAHRRLFSNMTQVTKWLRK